MRSTLKIVHTVAAVLLAAVAGSAQAKTYSFACISSGAAQACADGAAAITMDVTAASGGRVDFTFRNFSALGSSLTEIYFDDGTLLGISTVSDSGAGVLFSQIGSGSPSNLPGGNSLSPAFVTTAGFLIDTGSGGPSKGVGNLLDAGVQEYVTIRFNLINGKTFSDTISALDGPLGDGNDLRVGVHAKAYTVTAGDSSASFINTVPEGNGLALAMAGMLGLWATSRRMRG